MRKHQTGMSYIGIMVLLVIIGFLVKVIALLAPPYLDYHSTDVAIRGTLAEYRAANPSVGDIRKSLATRLQVENVTLQNVDDLVVTKEGNTINITIKYDVTRPFMGNIDAVFHFNKSYSSETTSQ